MISNNIKKALQSGNAHFFSQAKKQKMELTLRTPYKTYFEKFEGFSRIVAKTNEAALIIQNKSPASLYVLPPGNIKIKLTEQVDNTTGDLLHLGGWAVIHADNTCEINLMDCFEKSEVRPDQFDNSDVPQAREDQAGKYTQKLRKSTARVFTKKAV